MIYPISLRCEYRKEPSGIDTVKPRLSWLLESNDHTIPNQVQSAYQIRVATQKEMQQNESSELWDSGKVESNRTCHIEYDGKPLSSRLLCWWTVRVWDGEGNISRWSEPARWTMGLLSPADWKAQWIGYDEWEQEYDRTDRYRFEEGFDHWIWALPGENQKGDFYFRYEFTIDDVDEIGPAPFLITADETFVLYINGTEAGRSDTEIFSWTRPVLPDVKRFLQPGKNVIGIHARNSYLEKPGVTGKLFLRFADGSEKIIRTGKDWKVSGIAEAGWNTPDFNSPGWNNAHIVAPMGDKPWRVPAYRLKLPPPPYLRKTFSVEKRIKHAFIHAGALGLFELRVNGRKVSADKLTPGWSDYHKRVYYNTYEVTDYIQRGSNGIGIILAGGWYAGYIGWERRREYYGKNPRAIAQIEIEFEDGTHETVGTDSTWKAAYGPIREADLLMGEKYDARLDEKIDGWDTAGFNDDAWMPVAVSESVIVKLQSYPGNPVRCVQERQAIQLNEVVPGVYIFDLGQNIAGYVRLKINEAAGIRIKVRHGEVLNGDGTLYTENLRMAAATDVYIAKGAGEEVFELRFTCHGFRYVEVIGCTHPPAPDAVTGCVIHSDMDETGDIETSDPLVNRIYENIKWSQRGNFIDIPTDCPQRDERLGWTDNHQFFPVASYNMDVAAFYTKWLIDLNDAQEPGGAYPAIAPCPDIGVGPLYPGAPAWADSGVLIPYYMYKRYGDVRVLQTYYPNMKKYIDYLIRNSDNCIRPDYGYGDWLSVNAHTPRPVIGAAYFARVCNVMGEIAVILDKPEESTMYSDLYHNIREAFNKEFVNRKGKIEGDTQTGYVLAIQCGLLDKETELKAFQFLVADIESRGYHVSTGFLGIPFVLQVLTKYNRTDIAYRLLTNETYPSWGYMVKNGATTMWERWDSYTPERGIYDPLMNSFNHFSLGAFGSWLYETMGGIRQADAPGADFNIKPETGGRITESSVSYKSIKGIVKVRWSIIDKFVNIEITVPVNSRAKAELPAYASVEYESPAGRFEKVSEDANKILLLGSGRYRFRYRKM